MARPVRNIVEDVLGPHRTRELWSASYSPVLPFTPLDFDIGAVLPAMLYMARFGQRRGQGNFHRSFSGSTTESSGAPTIGSVARGLASRPESSLKGFDDDVGHLLLGDLLLAFCLENRRHALGHSEKVQRIFPTHYFASWVDLPKQVANLRGVPELLTALLANQESGEWLERGGQRGRSPVGVDFEKNRLLKLFGRHTGIRGSHESNLASDSFREPEANDVGVDELLAVRLALACGSGPEKARGKQETENIPNRRPLARRAAEFLREDLSIFIDVYGGQVPRQSFLQMAEGGIALGLTNILLSTAHLLAIWENSGQVPEPRDQTSLPLFADCSHGQDRDLRHWSENSVVECSRRFDGLPVLMMLLRILDDKVRSDRKFRDALPASAPDATEWVNLLGEVYKGHHSRSEIVLESLEESCDRLAGALEGEGEMPAVVERLRSQSGNPALRLAEALVDLMGPKIQLAQFKQALESALLSDQPNGLARTRRGHRSEGGTGRSIEQRSIVLTHPVLDFLVHRHLRKAAKGKPFHPLSLPDFLGRLRDRYGLYVAQEPPGQPVPQEVLLRNKQWLERRLRDLGLLRGVNDAETMKQLTPRYRSENGDVA